MATSRSISVGIDIGTSSVKVLVAENDPKNAKALPRVIAVGEAESKGMRHGYVTNVAEVALSIRMAVAQAEKAAGFGIKKAYISIGGIGVSAIVSTGAISITKADAEITELDVNNAINESEKELPSNYILNRRIIHSFPLEYRIDGKKVLGQRPQGLRGVRLEARVMYISCLTHHFNDLLSALEEANIEPEDIIASPIAASLVALNKTQKIAGCVLANIGYETTSIIVYEDNIPVSLEVFTLGSNDITNDIALGLKISIEDAEQVKIGAPRALEVPKKKLDDVTVARLSDIFELVDDHLTKISRSGLLPAGIVLIGGGSGLASIEELSKVALRLPAKQANIRYEGMTKGITRNQEWTVAYGLAFYGLRSDGEEGGETGVGARPTSEGGFMAWIKQFLP